VLDHDQPDTAADNKKHSHIDVMPTTPDARQIQPSAATTTNKPSMIP